MTDGMYTPENLRAAPNTAPAAPVAKTLVDMIEIVR